MSFWTWIRLSFGFATLEERCKYSTDKKDYHDYPNSIEGEPWHMVDLTCKTCGKKFHI